MEEQYLGLLALWVRGRPETLLVLSLIRYGGRRYLARHFYWLDLLELERQHWLLEYPRSLALRFHSVQWLDPKYTLSEVKKTEVLMENFRPIGLRIEENKEAYEGEVTELTPEETESVTGGYGISISHVIVGLKTVKKELNN